MDHIIEKIAGKIEKGDEISPFLFVGENLELLHQKVDAMALELCQRYSVDTVHIHTLEDDGESLKISVVKTFFASSTLQTQGGFQIFILENISRLTLSSANSCLKLFEEPGIQNLIFLTNRSEAGILDTILSRVQLIRIDIPTTRQKSEFYFSLIEKYVNKKDPQIFSYFFQNTKDRQEQLIFLQELLSYVNIQPISNINSQELFNDIQATQKNNVGIKGIIDKYLLQL